MDSVFYDSVQKNAFSFLSDKMLQDRTVYIRLLNKKITWLYDIP